MEQDGNKQEPIRLDDVIAAMKPGKTGFPIKFALDKLRESNRPVIMTFEMEPTTLERKMIEATKGAPQRLMEASMIPSDRMLKPFGIIARHYGVQ